MCGFAGALRLGRRNEEWEHDLGAMAAAITHRGPDAEGTWFDAESGVGLAHRRLSILDLSPQGAQPMSSADGRYVIAYNGEVYNFPELRAELEGKGIAWRGHSDTEVILAAIQAWGLLAAVEKFVGMFAFALWDRQGRVLSLVRDRLGIKPLYYGWGRDSFLFGSELKALRAHSDFEATLNRDALALQLRHSFVPAPHSIYRGFHKLEAGRILTVPLAAIAARGSLSDDCYWSALEVANRGQSAVFKGSDCDAVEELDRLLRDAVKLRMVSDVPIGAFLSGGIDSSTVVALMQAQSANPVKTFTVGFNESRFDEARYAKAVALRLGTDHYELYVTPEAALDVIPKLPRLYDEPFSDPSQIPTHLISVMARRDVTVCLSGDGGDELFAGYDRYATCCNIWNKVGWAPKPLRRAMAGLIAGGSAEKLKKVAEVLSYASQDELYRRLISDWKSPSRVVLGACEPSTVYNGGVDLPASLQPTHRMMLQDILTYLPDDILAKVDRASMGVGLEARVPILDHRVVEFAWSLPLSMKAGAGESKRALRRVLHRYLPATLFDRPKSGFGVPIDSWLRGPLREWAEEHLNAQRLQRQGVFDPQPIREKWQQHLSGARDWHYYLWDILMFQSWQESVEREPQRHTAGMAAK